VVQLVAPACTSLIRDGRSVASHSASPLTPRSCQAAAARGPARGGVPGSSRPAPMTPASTASPLPWTGCARRRQEPRGRRAQRDDDDPGRRGRRPLRRGDRRPGGSRDPADRRSDVVDGLVGGRAVPPAGRPGAPGRALRPARHRPVDQLPARRPRLHRSGPGQRRGRGPRRAGHRARPRGRPVDGGRGRAAPGPRAPRPAGDADAAVHDPDRSRASGTCPARAGSCRPRSPRRAPSPTGATARP
jgi:hypothetical protein